jgi:hypothetical protein
VGSPTEADLHFVTSAAARNYMLRQTKCAAVPFQTIFPHVRGPCLDLLERMLKFDPAKRITVDVSTSSSALRFVLSWSAALVLRVVSGHSALVLTAGVVVVSRKRYSIRS